MHGGPGGGQTPTASSPGSGSRPTVIFKWQPSPCNYLASVGLNNIVHITDRHGAQVDSFQLPGPCSSAGWTPDGELLVAVVESSPLITCWDATQTRTSSNIDTGMKGLHRLAWSHAGDVLAVGSMKGNLLLYNRRTSKKIPIIGKHSKAIVCAAWSREDVLACGSLDNTFTLTNLAGDTIFQMGLKGDPSEMQWSTMKTPSTSAPTAVLSIVLSSKTLFFHTLSNPDSPIELAFQGKYGNIVTYSWFSDGLVMIGFSTGYFVVVSTNINEIGQELFQARNHKDSLSNIAISSAVGKAATSGDGSVKVHELTDLKDVYAILDLEDERGCLEGLEWSEDGGFLTVGSRTGAVYSFLSRLPVLGGAFDTITAHLTGMCEMTITDHTKLPPTTTAPTSPTSGPGTGAIVVLKKDLTIEPSVVGIGPSHWAAALNDRCYFYFGGWAKRPVKWGKAAKVETARAGDLILQKDYVGSIKAVYMSDTLAAVLLSDGRLQVHSIDVEGVFHIVVQKRELMGRASNTVVQMIFPEKDVYSKLADAGGITAVALSNDLLVYSLSNGVIHHYSIEDWALVHELKHNVRLLRMRLCIDAMLNATQKVIVGLYPQPNATKFIFRDESNDAYVCEPARDDVQPIPNLSAKTAGILWESNGAKDRCIFISWDDAFITTHVFQPFTIKGPQCLSLGTTKLPFSLKPILFTDGCAICQTPSGRLSSVQLSTHEPLSLKNLPALTEQAQGKALQLAYTLGLMTDVWAHIESITSRKAWTMFAEASLYILDLPTARRVYRQILHDAGMVMALSSTLSTTEDHLALAGHVCVIFRDFDHAQELFLASSQPEAALHLRRDLAHWDQALGLASKLAPEEVTEIARECAARLEAGEKYADALAMYERALETSSMFVGEPAQLDEHQIACSAGITRMTFRMGDVTRGMRMLGG
ncbi:WD repeat-containing protein 19, partial [Irineochytrium annulatum]